jgi:hypothetical protein
MPSRYDLGPKPRLGYTQSPLERAAELRLKKSDVDALAASANAGVYVVGGEMIVTKAGEPLNDPLFTMKEAAALAETTETIFLGALNGAGRFAFGIAPQAAEALNDKIVVDRSELEDARWFSRDEVASMLMRKHPQELTCPPPVAIAHHIVRAWVEDEIGFD